MEDPDEPSFNSHLRNVLRSFRANSMNSLSGPAGCSSAWNEQMQGVLASTSTRREPGEVTVVKTEPVFTQAQLEFSMTPPDLRTVQVPLLYQQDQSRSDRQETVLESELISCFIVGGEKRLCLPQILNNVLKEFSLQQIYAECDDMQIFCSRCNQEQLEILKICRILPFSAPSCGLITKTDAERLCSRLLHSKPPKAAAAGAAATGDSFRVYHECFGRCSGVFSPENYVSADADCMECCECGGVFTPRRFVAHSHVPQENRTCHWGFDSSSWRSYLLLAHSQKDMERLGERLEEMKDKFDISSRKRKQNVDSRDAAKRTNSGEIMQYYHPYGLWYQQRAALLSSWVGAAIGKDGCYPGERGLHPFLSNGPPVLLNPDRVVRSTEISRFGSTYQPNVSLKPQAQPQDNNGSKSKTQSDVTQSPPEAQRSPTSNGNSDPSQEAAAAELTQRPSESSAFRDRLPSAKPGAATPTQDRSGEEDAGGGGGGGGGSPDAECGRRTKTRAARGGRSYASMPEKMLTPKKRALSGSNATTTGTRTETGTGTGTGTGAGAGTGTGTGTGTRTGTGTGTGAGAGTGTGTGTAVVVKMEAEEEEVPMEIADADATEDAGDECYSITSEMKAVEAALQDVIDSPHDNDKREWLFDRILRVKVKRENQLQQVISDNRQLTKEIARLRASTGRRRGGGGATPPAAPPDNDVQQQQQQQDWERVTERLQAENQSLVAENTRLQAAVAEMAETIEHLSVAAGNARSNGDA